MARVRVRGEAIRRYIIGQVEKHPSGITKVAMAKFGITRQAVNIHLHRLVDEGALIQEGDKRSRAYRLAPLVHWNKGYTITDDLAEDRPWREDMAPSLGQIPHNALGIWQYAFTEMFNNALDHSEGSRIEVDFEKTAASTQVVIYDDGIGIFKKIQSALGLLDERHAVLELAKGKFTTDPARHTGEGIFFSSRMFDDFQILSGGIFFTHKFEEKEDWILERDRFSSGTAVWMKLGNHTSRTEKAVFDRFTEDDDYGFTKTVVPVKLAKYGDDNLVSRSQAKRLLARVDRFKTVMLDFSGVDSLGHSFADEVFRVFPAQHPDMTLIEIHANSAVKRMISRARGSGGQ
jgi:anti-sigma regulatory factor (Ser/Thr protein kinase)